MLRIIYELGPFFEDCYRSISVREYARIIKVSPPTASKMLKQFTKERYLLFREERGCLLFSLSTMNEEVADLCRVYWKQRLSKLITEMKIKLTGGSAILFGSLVKAE